MRYFQYIFGIVILLFIAILTSLNAQTVTIHYFFGTFEIFLPVLLILFLLMGVLLGGILLFPKLLNLKRANHHLSNQVRKDQKENKVRTELNTNPSFSDKEV